MSKINAAHLQAQYPKAIADPCGQLRLVMQRPDRPMKPPETIAAEQGSRYASFHSNVIRNRDETLTGTGNSQG
ncbi:MAG: hypothetical protein K0U79_14630 [Gammaproteobacteria bacterium]|nr:hypothetical protein [Gammaproteobacteria bacterium]